MEKEAFSTSILRYIGRPRIKMTIMKNVNFIMQNSKKMVSRARACVEKVKKAFE